MSHPWCRCPAAPPFFFQVGKRRRRHVGGMGGRDVPDDDAISHHTDIGRCPSPPCLCSGYTARISVVRPRLVVVLDPTPRVVSAADEAP